MEQRSRFFGSAFGTEHIHGRENARSLLLELNLRREVLYAHEVIRMAFEAMARNFIDLAGGGIRRMLRVTRERIRRESLAEYALLPRDGGSPVWVSPTSFDMQSDIGFWRAKFIPRFDAKFENGLTNNALESGLSFSSSTAGESEQTAPGVGDQTSQFPIPGFLSEDEVEMSYTHSPTKGERMIFWAHSAWRDFPRGNACNFTHCMAPTKNLQWLIRSQLAKRGGAVPK